MAAVGALLLWAAPASAGLYSIDQCRVTGGSTPKGVLSEWTGVGVGEYNDCQGGGTFGYHLNEAPAGAVGFGQEKWFTLSVPSAAPNTTLRELQLSYRFPGHGGNLAFFGVLADSTVVHEEQLPVDRTASPLQVGLPEGTTQLRLRYYCSTANGAQNCTYSSPWQVFQITRARLSLTESVVPSASVDGGTLTGGGAKSGTKSLAYSATDADSGVERIRIFLGSTVVADVDYTGDASACPRDSWAACRRDRNGQTASIDTTRVPDGVHELTLVVEDPARNTRTVSGGEVTVDNVPSPSPQQGSGPTIEGSPRVGGTLTANPGTWSGSGVTHAYQWMRCDADGNGCTNIGTGTNRTYTVSSRDAGSRLKVKVVGTNDQGSAEATSEPTPVIAEPTDPNSAPSTPAPESRSPGVQAPQDRGEANGAGASDRARLSAFFGRARRTTVRTRYGRSARLSGRLVDPSNNPISGATLQVMAEPRVRAAQMDDLGTVRTDSDGRFTYTLSAGPSRLVRIGYRSHLGDTQFADTTDVLVLVQAGVSLRPSPRKLRNGNVGTFSGRAAQPIPLRGVLVDLQVRVGRQWRTFAVVRTHRDGRYRYRHRFRNTFVRTTFRFRARVRRETDYPYVIGYSRVAKMKVRP
jgi:hypothetical protein